MSNTAEEPKLYETVIALGSKELDTVVMAALHPNIPLLGTTAVSRSVLLKPPAHVLERSTNTSETAEHTLELFDTGYAHDGQSFKIPRTSRGAQYIGMNLLVAHPDSAVSLASAEKSNNLAGAITSLLRKHTSGTPTLTKYDIGGRAFYGLRENTRIIDQRAAAGGEDQPNTGNITSALGGAALFKRGELASDRLIKILNITHVNSQTEKLKPHLPPSMSIKELVIISSTKVQFNNVPLEPGKPTIHFLNRLLAAYHGPALTIEELLQTDNSEIIKKAESFARRLEAQGVIVRATVDGRRVLALYPSYIIDKR
jgi:hypothetical protein